MTELPTTLDPDDLAAVLDTLDTWRPTAPRVLAPLLDDNHTHGYTAGLRAAAHALRQAVGSPCRVAGQVPDAAPPVLDRPDLELLIDTLDTWRPAAPRVLAPLLDDDHTRGYLAGLRAAAHALRLAYQVARDRAVLADPAAAR